MKTYITPKDLQKLRGYVYVTAQRKIKKVKQKYQCNTVSIQQYCEFFNENYIEIFALLNAKNEADYLRIIREGMKEGFSRGFAGWLRLN